jgi:hypothetical protein
MTVSWVTWQWAMGLGVSDRTKLFSTGLDRPWLCQAMRGKVTVCFLSPVTHTHRQPPSEWPVDLTLIALLPCLASR